MRGKKGFATFYALGIGVLIFFLALAITPSLFETTNQSTTSTELNCSNSSLTQQEQAVCTQMNLMPYLFFSFMLGIAGFIIGGSIL